MPTEVATGGYRLRINGHPADGLTGVLDGKSVQGRPPVEAVQAPGETVLTVEALFSPEHPQAIRQSCCPTPPAGTG